MNVEVSASVCCSWDAVRISVEKGVAVTVASKAGLRGRGGREVREETEISARHSCPPVVRADGSIFLLRHT
ncbi:hypothetical protein JCM13580A_47310 [Streptomyces drozdowiczii]